MARPPRIEYEGAVYHVMCRGDRREPVFPSADDNIRFLETLGETCGRSGFLVHAYALMINHYHLLLETPEANLVAGMKWLQGTYTARFNSRHRVVGHLFQGRYKALVVDGENPEYFRTVSDYIHLNPARCPGMLEGDPPRLESYPWTSFPHYLGRPSSRPAWLRVDRVLASHGLGGDRAEDRRRYRSDLETRALELLERADPRKEHGDEWGRVRRGWYLGGESFRGRLLELLEQSVRGRRRDSYGGPGISSHDEKRAEDLLASCLAALGTDLEQVRRMRQTEPVKQALAWRVRTRTVVGSEWIVRKLEMGHASNVTRAARAFRQPGDRTRRRLRRLLECKD